MRRVALIKAPYCPFDLAAIDVVHEAWRLCASACIDHYWSGAQAPPGRRAEARILWTEFALCVRFTCQQSEPLVINNNSPQRDFKTLGLWQRDVCEVFIAPNMNEPNCYFEFEAAPSGEWVDLGLRIVGSQRETEWDFRSDMSAHGEVRGGLVTISMRIPWSERLPKPKKGDQWRLNLCRCVGEDPNRGYLAWQPTLTPEPNFHVPAAFGTILFN